MINLISLSFQNIGRFVEKQTIDFSSKQKLLQFDGLNENTGGSSGAGKSTAFHALDLNLGLNDTPASSLQSRLTKEGFWTHGEYLINNVPVSITRSKKDGLIVKTPTETVEGNIKLAEEAIDRLIGIPRALFKKMIHKKQKEGGFFLNLTAKQSYDFLSEALSMQEYEAKCDKIDLDIDTKTKSLTTLTNEIESVNRNLESLRATLASVEKPEALDVEDIKKQIQAEELIVQTYTLSVANIRSTMEKAQSEIHQAMLAKLLPEPKIEGSVELERLQHELSSVILEEKGKKDNLEKTKILAKDQVKISSDKISEIKFKERQVKAMVPEIVALKEQKTHLEASKCPTCSQEWKGADLDAKIKQINDSIESKTKEVLSLKGLLDQIPELERIKSEAEEALKEMDLRNNVISTEYSDKKSKISFEMSNINQLKNDKLREWKLLNQEIENESKIKKFELEQKAMTDASTFKDGITSSNQKIVTLNSQISIYTLKVESYEKVTSSTQTNIKQNEEKLNTTISKRALVEQEIVVASESKRLIKTYTLQIFQDTLNFIGSYATQILNAIPTMSNATLYFENCKETKTGKIKDEVNCVINVDGENDVPVKTLSGGERTAVDLAIDLAVIEVLESQTGKGADWIILDEPFTGLDSIGCEAAIDIIKQAGLKKRIIIVDHNPEVKQIIEETITVVRKGLESTISNGI